jgi:hypothetical protein
MLAEKPGDIEFASGCGIQANLKVDFLISGMLMQVERNFSPTTLYATEVGSDVG